MTDIEPLTLSAFRSVLIFSATPEQLASYELTPVRVGEDEVEAFEVAFLQVAGHPVAVRRYKSQRPNTYTVLLKIDSRNAQALTPDELMHEFMHQTGIAYSSVIWANEELLSPKPFQYELAELEAPQPSWWQKLMKALLSKPTLRST